MILSARVLLTIILALYQIGAVAAEPRLTYQRVHALVAHHDNQISLRVWKDHTVEMRFPPYMRLAGLYRWQASAGDLDEVDRFFRAVEEAKNQDLPSAMLRAGQEEMIRVADADRVRVRYRGSERSHFDFDIEAPDAWSRALPARSALQTLAEAEQSLRQWMRTQAAPGRKTLR